MEEALTFLKYSEDKGYRFRANILTRYALSEKEMSSSCE
jgi:hypothetical protein